MTGAPAVIMRQRDTEVHSGPAAPEDVLEIWHFDVDWQDESNTTFVQLDDIDVAEFSSELCGLTAFACFEQPGTGTTLDPLREVIMNRLQYRNFGDYEVLMGNFVTDVDGTERGGVRWFELRRTGGITAPWTLFQEGLVSPDSDSRFMAGSAMDQSGNIAIAYNVTSDHDVPVAALHRPSGRGSARLDAARRVRDRRRRRVQRLEPLRRLLSDGCRPRGRLHLLVHRHVQPGPGLELVDADRRVPLRSLWL